MGRGFGGTLWERVVVQDVCYSSLFFAVRFDLDTVRQCRGYLESRTWSKNRTLSRKWIRLRIR